VVSKTFVSAAITAGAVVAIAAPAGAEPGMFNDLSCSCLQTVSDGGSGAGPINRGIPAGLTGAGVVEATQ
jgi:hypothetical protein